MINRAELFAREIIRGIFRVPAPTHSLWGSFLGTLFSGITWSGPVFFSKIFRCCVELFPESSRTLPDFLRKRPGRLLNILKKNPSRGRRSRKLFRSRADNSGKGLPLSAPRSCSREPRFPRDTRQQPPRFKKISGKGLPPLRPGQEAIPYDRDLKEQSPGTNKNDREKGIRAGPAGTRGCPSPALPRTLSWRLPSVFGRILENLSSPV